VSPGPISTPSADELRKTFPGVSGDAWLQMVPLGRIGTTDDIEEVVALLVSAGEVGAADADDPWLAPWIDAEPARLQEYIAFLDWRRWQAVNRDGEIIAGVALPPCLDFESGRFVLRL
jgi:NAD(P)-dependent dehydrogenase (short-subunit alcohol dehydrogenase family)